MTKLLKWAAGLAIAPVLAAGLAIAHEGAEGVVLERMELMKSMAGEARTLGEMLTGKVPFDREVAAQAATGIAEHAAEIPEHFPEGSDEAPSKAKDSIWTSRADFERTADTLNENALALEAAIENGEDPQQLMPLFQSVAATCQSCHESFRSN